MRNAVSERASALLFACAAAGGCLFFRAFRSVRPSPRVLQNEPLTQHAGTPSPYCSHTHTHIQTRNPHATLHSERAKASFDILLRSDSLHFVLFLCCCCFFVISETVDCWKERRTEHRRFAHAQDEYIQLKRLNLVFVEIYCVRVHLLIWKGYPTTE